MPNAPGTVSTTLPTRMGIAAPSLAEASSRLPSSVKAGPASADDVLVTSVASSPPAVDEPVSPELALVDPELRERLRALLPEIELEPPPPVLRALPDPEPEEDLALTPPPELVEAAVPVPLRAPVATLAVRPAQVYVYPTRGERVRSFAKAFALGAAAATVVTVGVIAELGDGPAAPQDPGTTPPRVAAPVPVPTPNDSSGGSTTGKTAKPASRRVRSEDAATADAQERRDDAQARHREEVRRRESSRSLRRPRPPRASRGVSPGRQSTAPSVTGSNCSEATGRSSRRARSSRSTSSRPAGATTARPRP